ncbi:HEPN domain-containing protein [bacterium]|nr:HEPN domain-containing protein [bacterium]NCP08872.1 HEPN domain-containing protein [bacterium]
MKNTTLNWIKSSNYDFNTAVFLLKSKRYIYVVFMCHLSLEKVLKAILSEAFSELPPRTRNLNRLLELGGITLPENMQAFVNAINLQSVPTRYPEDFTRLSKEIDGKTAAEYVRQTRRIIRWLKKNIPYLK